MTKIICINKKRFEQIVGYGSWSVISVGLIIMFSAVIYDQYHWNLTNPNGYDSWNDVGECTRTILTHDLICSNYSSVVTIGLWGAGFVANFGFMTWFFYDKQQKFKFSWCLKGENKE